MRQTFSTLRRGGPAGLIAVWLLAPWAPSALAQSVGDRRVEEEELAAEELASGREVTIDLERLRERFANAERIFESADQPASLPQFTAIIEAVELAVGDGSLEEAANALLVEALSRRAQVRFNLGETAEAASDLRRTLELMPHYDLDRTLVSPKLVDLFDDLRREVVGMVELTVDPPDAVVRIDGQAIERLERPIGVSAGTRLLTVDRPGYAPLERHLEVLAGRTQRLQLILERVSPVLRLSSRPSGAEVRIDGQLIGVTQPPVAAPSADEGPVAVDGAFSAELVVDRLPLGRHTLEVRKVGFRAFRVDLQLMELLDYAPPPIVLEEERGLLALNGLPRDAQVVIDGRPVPTASRIALPPGDHHVMVSDGPTRMFSSFLQLADRQTMEIQLRLRPGVALMGVLGGDRDEALAVHRSIGRALGGSGEWTMIDRSVAAREVLEPAGATAQALRGAGDGGETTAIDWPALQAAADRRMPSLLFVLGVLSNDLVATHADLWIWSAAPGPAKPDRLRIAVDDPEALDRLAAALAEPLELYRSHLGALVIDSAAAAFPVVFDLSEGGPAERAGLQIGDQIDSVSGVRVDNAAALEQRIRAAESGESVPLGVRSKAGNRTVPVRLTRSPQTVSLDDPALLPSLAFATLRRQEEGLRAEDRWIYDLNHALLLLRTGEWQEAVRRLRRLEVPDSRVGLGKAAADYWLGLALAAAGPSYRQAAEAALARAADAEGARLIHDDGPFVAPRARARLAVMASGAPPPGER